MKRFLAPLRFAPLLAALALASCTVVERKDEVTVGDLGQLDFYYLCATTKCDIDTGRGIPLDPDAPSGSVHVIFVEVHGGAGAIMPQYTFESDDLGVFEVLEVGCNGTCGPFACDYETVCPEPYLYQVSLKPVALGSAKLMVYDQDSVLVDSATVTILPNSSDADAGT